MNTQPIDGRRLPRRPRGSVGRSILIRVDPEVYAELQRLRHPSESLQVAVGRIVHERLGLR